MRRVLRHFFTFAAGLSLLLCIAVCVLWARSYRLNEGITRGRPDPTGMRRVFWYCSSSVGGIKFGYCDHRRADGAEFRRINSYYNVRRGGWRVWSVPYNGGPGKELARLRSFDAGSLQDQRILMNDGYPDAGTIATGIGSDTWLTFPHWVPAVLFGSMPTWQLIHRLTARRRRARGLCRRCGYDLRASPERCPECGTPVPSNSPATPSRA
jgi:hypothetical protein